MIIFGLTGGSGTGKTTVAKIFEENGIYVAYADVNARNVEKKGMQCYDELVAMFGTEILKEDGELDRRKLGKIVFNDKEKLKTLNRITHHYIKYDIMRELRDAKADFAAIDGAVIIGSPVEELCSFVVSVESDTETRVQRIVERDGLTEEYARARILAQPDNNFYREHSRYIIENNGSSEDLRKNAEEVIEKIKENK